ncbi:MAG: MazG nucleotide pyrophosphohydrolase domain-containing protein [Hyphomonadaceae bacterium]
MSDLQHDFRALAWLVHTSALESRGLEVGAAADQRFTALALVGEAGELANLVKKEWRRDWGVEPGDLDAAVADECADVLVYLYLFARMRGIDLEAATNAKMMRVARKYAASGEFPALTAALAENYERYERYPPQASADEQNGG